MIYPAFTWPHIIYLVIFALLIAGGCFFFLNKKISEKSKEIVIRILAGITVAAVITKQVSFVIEHVDLGESNAWVYAFPNSYCSFSALLLGILVLCGDKNGFAMHFLVYNVLIGCTPSVIYPDYLNSKPFFAYGTMGSLVFHMLAVVICILLIVKKDFKPTLKKWYCFPIGFAVMLGFGFLLVYGFGSGDAMNITKPLISDIKFSYWYTLFPLCWALAVLLTLLLSKLSYRSNKKQ